MALQAVRRGVDVLIVAEDNGVLPEMVEQWVKDDEEREAKKAADIEEQRQVRLHGPLPKVRLVPPPEPVDRDEEIGGSASRGRVRDSDDEDDDDNARLRTLLHSKDAEIAALTEQLRAKDVEIKRLKVKPEPVAIPPPPPPVTRGWKTHKGRAGRAVCGQAYATGLESRWADVTCRSCLKRRL